MAVSMSSDDHGVSCTPGCIIRPNPNRKLLYNIRFSGLSLTTWRAHLKVRTIAEVMSGGSSLKNEVFFQEDRKHFSVLARELNR